ncbi:hypothetical protein LEMLEM_LOCUS24812 [Lemmus lemmus]
MGRCNLCCGQQLAVAVGQANTRTPQQAPGSGARSVARRSELADSLQVAAFPNLKHKLHVDNVHQHTSNSLGASFPDRTGLINLNIVLLFLTPSVTAGDSAEVGVTVGRVGDSQSCWSDIFEWARDHRAHHKYSETVADPTMPAKPSSSPTLGGCWFTSTQMSLSKKLNVTDLLADPVV